MGKKEKKCHKECLDCGECCCDKHCDNCEERLTAVGEINKYDTLYQCWKCKTVQFI